MIQSRDLRVIHVSCDKDIIVFINFKSRSLFLCCTLYSTLTFANYTPLTQWLKIKTVDFAKITYHIYNMDYSFIKNRSYDDYLKLSSTPFPYRGSIKKEGAQGDILIVIVRSSVCRGELTIPFFEENGALATLEQTYHIEIGDARDPNCSRRNKVDVVVEKDSDPSLGYTITMEYV
ncbi:MULTISPECIES: hypothetical protein [Legionella]|uniref:hypothetical protein n=1 Tax=Legionella TaxID=445 RepID=UPI00095B8624|nr:MULTISPECIES: hypothetical protein [Legionella]MBN9226691.1 hypothetical protein [Legionella steelei]OJW06752.1 MAG: hypothetical protein BGO44_18380 [Legionella sp. 39-23]